MTSWITYYGLIAFATCCGAVLILLATSCRIVADRKRAELGKARADDVR